MAEDPQTTVQRIKEGSKVLPKRRGADLWHPLRVVVDQDAIDNATRRDSYNCMIAEAIKDLLNLKGTQVKVNTAHIRITNLAANLKCVYFTPTVAQRQLVFFDSGEHMEPFYFHLGKPAQVVRAGRKTTPLEDAADRKSRSAQRSNIKRGVTKDGYPSRTAMAAARRPAGDLSVAVDAPIRGAVDDEDTRVSGYQNPVRIGGDEFRDPPGPRKPNGSKDVPGQLKALRRYGANEFVA